MYYKIENKECEVYKKLHQMRTEEIQIGKENEKAIEEKRAANKAHQKKINNEILSGLVTLGCSEQTGQDIIKAIVKGQIKNISINY